MSVVTIRGNLGSGAPEIGKLVAGNFTLITLTVKSLIKWQNYCKGKNMISR